LLGRPSLAGTGLTERMRSTTFALLGITAAAGLGMVAIFSQQGWPLLSPSPVPSAPMGQTAVHPAVTLGPAGTRAGIAGPARPASGSLFAAGASPAHRGAGSGATVGSRHQVGHGGSTGPGGVHPGESPGGHQPTPTPAPPSAEAPVAAAPAPAPTPAPATTPSSSQASAAAVEPPKGHAYGHTGTQGEQAASEGDGQPPGHGYGHPESGDYGNGGSHGYGHHYTPPPPPPVAAPPAPEAAPTEPPAPEESGAGHGHGHGYGHSSWHHG
jgi:hypothetical protein